MIDPRPEGGYVTKRIEDVRVETLAFFAVERVNGDQSVTSVEFTRIEAQSVRDQLTKLLADTNGET